jgi:hypothetical protein
MTLGQNITAVNPTNVLAKPIQAHHLGEKSLQSQQEHKGEVPKQYTYTAVKYH